MTKQIPDIVVYKDEKYILAGLKGKSLPVPNDFNIVQTGVSTACYRGYFCEYTCNDGQLFLTELSIIDTENQFHPHINNVAPEHILNFIWKYQNLKVKVPFSGGIVIVNNSVKSDRDIQPNPLKYQDVLEIRFEQGILLSEISHSSKVSELREIYDNLWKQITDSEKMQEKLDQWVLSPEQMTQKDSEMLDQYWNKLIQLEWAFVEGYEQQPPL